MSSLIFGAQGLDTGSRRQKAWTAAIPIAAFHSRKRPPSSALAQTYPRRVFGGLGWYSASGLWRAFLPKPTIKATFGGWINPYETWGLEDAIFVSWSS